MEGLPGKELANRIEKVLKHLKSVKITQSEIEHHLNYTSLSKAKNFDRYPQSIIEKKTRHELLNDLLMTYNLQYDEVNDEVVQNSTDSPKPILEKELVYIMYYYAFARETVGKAIVRIIGKKKVLIDYPMNEHWVGDYEIIENYTFIQAIKKGDTTPVKKLICLFSGTEKYGRPILLGTYSTVKRDGYPAAGNIVFELVEDELMIDAKIRSEVDPRIAHYLNDQVLVSETFTPNTLDGLNSDFRHINKYANNYKIFYKSNGDILEGELELNSNGSAQIIISSIPYSGVFRLLDLHTIKILLRDGTDFSHLIKEEISIIIQTNKQAFLPFYYGNGITNAFDSNQVHFECLLIPDKSINNDTFGMAKKLLE